jgi:twitching motility protein PilI
VQHVDSIAPFDAGAARILQALPPMTPVQALTAGFELEPTAAVAPAEAPARRLLDASQLAGGQSRQGFRIGELKLMIRYEDGSELTEMPEIYRLPGAPRWVLGMANLHGMLVPVFDPAPWFGVVRPAAGRPMLLVLGHGADAAGFVIDGLPERLRWHADQVADVATVPDAIAAVVDRAVLVDEALWFDLNLRSVLERLTQDLAAQAA